MTVRGRFAPSPSGSLHLGNARTALVAWLSARSAGGSFVLRVEDLDEARTVAQAVEGNLHELRWLGLDWDEGPDVGGAHAPYLQSRRHRHYRDALERLQQTGRVYECYLSRRELRDLASAPHGRSPVYGAAQRRANEAIRAARIAAGKAPSLRLQVDDGPVAFVDRMAGPQRASAPSDVGDIVLRRADGVWAYQLAVVVDDAVMEISEVVRGDDLLPSAATQTVLYRALGAEPPEFMHIPLLLDESGERMSKRTGSLTLEELRRRGTPAERIVGWLAFGLGLQDRAEPRTPQSLLNDYRPDRLARVPRGLHHDDLPLLGAEVQGAP